VTAAGPLDGERLADALRAYLDDLSIDVRTAVAAPGGDLRSELRGTDEIGAAVRAWAVVRIAPGAPGSAEIELVDRVTEKSLVTAVPRPRRDEDLYRAVALKVQALLRATLSEPSAAVASSPALARLAAAPPPPPREARFALETALAFVAFPGGGQAQQGLAVSGNARLGEHLEVALGTAALSSLRADAGAVSATVSRVPVALAARLRAGRERWEVTAGLVGEVAVVSLHASSPTLAVRSGWSLVPAAGAQAGGRLRLGGRAWAYGRVAALGVVASQHYSAQGQPLLALSGLELGGEAGLGVALW
jgi:hypothetical protein